MSWSADLEVTVDGHVLGVGGWNYTHNCNKMMSTVLEENGTKLESHWLIGHMGKSWFDALNGKTAPEGSALLRTIIEGMEDDPERFKAMEPPNGWGSYAGVLQILRQMLARSNSYPSAVWRVRG